MKRMSCLVIPTILTGMFLMPLAAANEDIDTIRLRGVGLLSPYIILSDRKRVDANTPQGRADVQGGIRLLTQVTEANPNEWTAFWLIGKGHQALRDHNLAHAAFARSYALRPNEADTAREYAIESICVGKTDIAVRVAEAATRIATKDPGLAANLALALLADGQTNRARAVVEDALQMSPNDPTTQALLAEINAVQARRPPSNYGPF